MSVEALHGFAGLVDRLGGHGRVLLTRQGIDPALMEDPKGLLPYRSLVRILEAAASELHCPDFGMKLASIQGPFKIIGPLGVAMRNSATLGDALRYCSKNNRVFSKAISVALEHLAGERYLLRFEVVLKQEPLHIQTIEHSMALLHHAIPVMSGDKAKPRQTWFMHEAQAKTAAYSACFSSRLRFLQAMNGLLLHESDLEANLANPDRQLYALATSFIDNSFPPERTPLSERLRMLITRWLREGECTQERASTELCMHPRTLQRRLCEEGSTFELIKDSVRRDAALYYLSQSNMPFVQVAAALGYWEVSTLSRSCHRWFSASPRRMRKALIDGEKVALDQGREH